MLLPVPRALILSALWAAFLALVLVDWMVTFRVPSLLLWTLAALPLFLLTALASLGEEAWRDRSRVRGPLIGWVAIVAGVALLHALVPRVIVQGQVVRTVTAVSLIDVVVPFWIALRALALAWGRRRLPFVLGIAVPLVMVAGYLVMIPMPGIAHEGPLPPASPSQQRLAERLRAHVEVLAGAIGERNSARPAGLDSAAAYVERELAASGLRVASHGYAVAGRRFRNLEVAIPGTSEPDRVLVVGAHYDSAPGSPGADDNASATAALIELARLLRADRPAFTIRLVAFTNEEPPFFQAPGMGSRVYASDARRGARGDVVAMLSLETIGYFTDQPGSQRYPFPFNLFYPDRGDFIAFVGDLNSRGLVRSSVRVFRGATAFPAHGVAAPAFVPGVNWSDHGSFWLYGYPALMITDTAPFRSHDYHTIGDSPEKLDYDRMARVVEGVAAVVRALAAG